MGVAMTKVRCPGCGVLHEIEQPKSNAFENRVRRPFRADAMAPTFPQPEINQQAPTGLPGWDSHVKIPLRQAVIFGLFDAPTGIGIGLVGGAGLAMLFNAASRDNLTTWGYVIIIGTGGAIGGLVALCQEAKKRWPERLEIYDALLWIEEVTGIDIDGDGEVGEPTANRVEVEIQEKGIPREIDTLDIDPLKLRELARLIVLEGRSFSERTAAEAGMSRDEEWIPLRDKLVSRRWAAWKVLGSPTQGVTLKPKGEAILEALLPPALSSGGIGQNNVGSTHARTPTQSNYERFDHIQGAK